MQWLAGFADIRPVCPEVAIGLGVPRPTIRLVRVDGVVRVRGVTDPSMDVTDALRDFAQAQLPGLRQLDGYLFKARSPSCGIRDVPVFHPEGRMNTPGSGYFAGFVHRQLPNLPLADEVLLSDPQGMAAFEQRVLTHFQRRQSGDDRP